MSSETGVYSHYEITLKKINENTVFTVMDYFAQPLQTYLDVELHILAKVETLSVLTITE